LKRKGGIFNRQCRPALSTHVSCFCRKWSRTCSAGIPWPASI
jgi:hypothetical protein